MLHPILSNEYYFFPSSSKCDVIGYTFSLPNQPIFNIMQIEFTILPIGMCAKYFDSEGGFNDTTHMCGHPSKLNQGVYEVIII